MSEWKTIASGVDLSKHQLTPSSSAGCTKAHSPRVLDDCTTATPRSSRIASHSSRYEVLRIQIGADTIQIKLVYWGRLEFFAQMTGIMIVARFLYSSEFLGYEHGHGGGFTDGAMWWWWRCS
ncbi:hypothetical protein L2E82_02818 [Cichorium intybus]|uniref:Uncharacterized protein n=1 Tax=Cichorium intybus TaxID=13427 RepID=A0ACB9H3U7_CICIN|nr:hypothetical protein L2E82_02818 [Cichorium intybus]